MTDLTQKLMDRAYDRWRDQRTPEGQSWSMQDFWDQLDASERVAVFAGNMNYQVGNGGWSQWMFNGYATDETYGFLLRLCDRMGTETSAKVKDLLERVYAAVGGEFDDSKWGETRYGDYDEYAADEVYAALDLLCTEYYRLDKAFLADVEAFLTAKEAS